ncbi:hypothetical protein [Asanoa ferruginea]|uniref:hypothetical protein n=1 Tax=Asanoa ferruginea TaxID=53367 RepID=UPI0011C0EEEC|nr:hypothetical protein [Asanoa ferruginea]
MTTTVAGGLVVLCATGAALSAAVPGRGTYGTLRGWNYPAAVWPLLAALACAGVVIVIRPEWLRPAAVVAAVVGAQVAGYGVVAVRDWFNANGAQDMASHNLATVVTFAAAVAVWATVATCVAVGLLWREPTGVALPGFRALVVGGMVAVGLPFALGAAFRDLDITSLGQYALTYSLPWGAALAAAGWLDNGEALAARATVAGSAVLAAVTVGAAFASYA